MAERPVIIFGKRKGKAKGEIHVKGISGTSPYIKTFNVSDVKPSLPHILPAGLANPAAMFGFANPNIAAAAAQQLGLN